MKIRLMLLACLSGPGLKANSLTADLLSSIEDNYEDLFTEY